MSPSLWVLTGIRVIRFTKLACVCFACHYGLRVVCVLSHCVHVSSVSILVGCDVYVFVFFAASLYFCFFFFKPKSCPHTPSSLPPLTTPRDTTLTLTHHTPLLGMPSSHAHMLFFLASYVPSLLSSSSSSGSGVVVGGALLSLPSSASSFTSLSEKLVGVGGGSIGVGMGLFGVALSSCVHRVMSGKHTLAQVRRNKPHPPLHTHTAADSLRGLF